MNQERLKDKRAIVTGAASGIGRAAALAFAEQGAAVVLSDLDEAVHDTAQTIRDAQGVAESMISDVTDEAAVQRLIETSVSKHGGLEIMFANAGITGPIGPFLEVPVSEWRRVLEVNLMGVVICTQLAAHHMKAHGGGSIICTASVAGLRSGAGPAQYSASKAGVINLCQTAASHLTGTGIRVNAICPGLVETGMTKPLFDLARARGTSDKVGQLNPTRRAGQPDEIAHAVVFLASDESSYVNGHALVVDGGLSASHPFVPGRIT